MAELQSCSSGEVLCLRIPFSSSIGSLDLKGIDLFIHRRKADLRYDAGLPPPLKNHQRRPLFKSNQRTVLREGMNLTCFGKGTEGASWDTLTPLSPGEVETTN
jgi:hypothetical protein